MGEPSWKCTDPVLCSYEVEIGGSVYHAQRTWCDTVAVWSDGERLTATTDLTTALAYAKEHARKTNDAR